MQSLRYLEFVITVKVCNLSLFQHQICKILPIDGKDCRLSSKYVKIVENKLSLVSGTS